MAVTMERDSLAHELWGSDMPVSVGLLLARGSRFGRMPFLLSPMAHGYRTSGS